MPSPKKLSPAVNHSPEIAQPISEPSLKPAGKLGPFKVSAIKLATAVAAWGGYAAGALLVVAGFVALVIITPLTVVNPFFALAIPAGIAGIAVGVAAIQLIYKHRNPEHWNALGVDLPKKQPATPAAAH